MSTLRRPPAIPAWLLRRLVSNDALVGDLTEEFRRGRSAAWYWRQVVTAIVVGRSRAYGPSALAVLGLVILYRVANYLPAPGTRTEALAIVGQQVGSTTLAAYDTHTGGNLSRVTWLALGILPYVTVSIVLQSLALAWWRMKVRWPVVRPDRVTALRRYLTIGVCVVQAAGVALFLERMPTVPGGLPLVAEPGWLFRLTTILTLTAGTGALVWVSEEITARGLGSGMVLMYLAGGVAGLPGAVATAGDLPGLAARLAVSMTLVASIDRAYRRAAAGRLLT